MFGPPGSGSVSQRYGSGSGLFYNQANDFFSLKNEVSVAIKNKKQTKFFVAVSKVVLTKIAGFGSGSVSQRYESANPDLYQNVTDPQHCLCDYNLSTINAKGYSTNCACTHVNPVGCAASNE